VEYWEARLAVATWEVPEVAVRKEVYMVEAF